MQKVIFTDLDKTLTYKDSFFQAVYFFGKKLNLVLFSPIILLVALLSFFGLISRDLAKKNTFYFVFKGLKKASIESKMEQFVAQIAFNQEVLNKIREYQNQGFKIIIVSASLDFYVRSIVAFLEFDGYICTNTLIKNSKLEKIKGKNCNYEEKARRIQESKYYPYDEAISFGNSRGDFEMFNLTGKHFFVDNDLIIENYLLRKEKS